jgi:hypothetical protein
MTVIPANPGFEILYVDTNDDRYTAEPIIAWSIEKPDDPQPITASGTHDGADVAVRYPNKGPILYEGRHYKDASGWLYAVENREG